MCPVHMATLRLHVDVVVVDAVIYDMSSSAASVNYLRVFVNLDDLLAVVEPDVYRTTEKPIDD